ncbi:hypothetical protein niasHS_011960 [Heterodera schachtii]|uniref:Transposase n=1 Tax=Heterodera schachtii TaxID=97005 RepID=A0ABD2IQ60_HETSC
MLHSEEEKLKLIAVFEKFKTKIRTKFPTISYKQIEKAATEKLKVNPTTIYRWRREFDLQKIKLRRNSEEEKLALKRRYLEMKDAQKHLEIADQLKIPSRTLSTLKREWNLIKTKKFSDEEKMEIIQKFEEEKGGFRKVSNEKAEQIAKELGVSQFTIFRWKAKFGMTETKTYKEAEKIKYVEQFLKIKQQYPKMSDVKISEFNVMRG